MSFPSTVPPVAESGDRKGGDETEGGTEGERTGGRGVRERRVIMRKQGVGDVKGGKDRKMWPRDDVREDRENNDDEKRLKIMVEGNKINYKKVLKVCLTLTSYFDMNIFYLILMFI